MAFWSRVTNSTASGCHSLKMIGPLTITAP